MGSAVLVLVWVVLLLCIILFAFQDIDELEDKVKVQGDAARWDIVIHGASSPLHAEIQKLIGTKVNTTKAEKLHLICGGGMPKPLPSSGRCVYLLDIEDLGKAETRAELNTALAGGCSVLHAGLHRREGYRSGSESVFELLKSIVRRDDLDALAIRVVGMATAESLSAGSMGGTLFGFVHDWTPRWAIEWMIGTPLSNTKSGAVVEG